MTQPQMPFRFIFLSQASFLKPKERQIISTLDKCGIFLCTGGEVEISSEGKQYIIRQGDMYIYITSALVHLLHRSPDAEGIMVEVDLDYLLPIVNKVMNVENRLFMQNHPCVPLSQAQYLHLKQLMSQLRERSAAEALPGMSKQHRHLTTELIKSMGQTLCYEVLDIYFTNQPLQPQPLGKKDLIFQNFMLSLFRFYLRERDVSFYAKMQHITPRYFSSIIKEKSGRNASQWIIQIVITEAKQLLEGSSLSIKEIAARLNFPTQSFFGKYFKHYAGLSPKAYRLQAADKAEPREGTPPARHAANRQKP